jgi:hypothetical protein
MNTAPRRQPAASSQPFYDHVRLGELGRGPAPSVNPRLTGRTASCITSKDLARVGLKPAPVRAHIGARSWFESGHIRVCLNGEEGIDVIGFDARYPIGHCMAWDAHFRAETPISVVMAAIEGAL